MKRSLLVGLGLFVATATNIYAREYWVNADDYRYSFSETPAWLGIGQKLDQFPQADMVFRPANTNRHRDATPYKDEDIYVFTNVTTGTPEGLIEQIKVVYGERSPGLAVKPLPDIEISSALRAKVTLVANITAKKKAQVIASIRRKGAYTSLVMQAASEQLLKEYLADFTKLLMTYRESQNVGLKPPAQQFIPPDLSRQAAPVR